ncbi:DKNYY domain-containing protein [Flavobacterium sp. LHD-85]|uniref:DKNYY domain-containing protein n=1 Tax=Flavobacterium sp. LHD-85 TaxID=3071410 RepID=UPI0027E09E1F|nr:DKNYY domain-containing protein [Flavobacterium sp. LHD-85]MDQ6531027.1 DKNYY domain-containing protein [Flavobacterium sp. LHD-85]
MIRIFLISISFVLFFSCQNTSIPALEDPALKIEYGARECNFVENPTYIVNKDYVVYQDACTHIVFYPNIVSFKPGENKESGFAFDKNGMYVKGEFLKIDTTGFVVLGRNEENDLLWKTKYKVFKNTLELKDIDVATFQPNPCKSYNGEVKDQYYKDKNFIYYFDKKIEGSDGATANTSPYDFCHDKKYIYFKGEVASFGGEPYQYVNCDFFKTEKYVFRNGELVDDMHPDNLKALSGHYTRYNNDVYFRGNKTPMKLKNSSKVKVWTADNYDFFITDGKSIFKDGKEIDQKVDLPSFGFLSGAYCFYDKNGIYERGYNQELKKDIIEKLPFKYYGKIDHNAISYNKFSGIVFYKNQAYATRTKSFYEDLSPKQIAVAKAQKNDVDDFDGSNKVFIDYNFCKMYDRIYFRDKRTSFDAETFAPMDEGDKYSEDKYYKDKNVVSYCNERSPEIKKMSDVDVNSARTFNIFLVDKNYLYCKNVKIIKSTGIELLASFSGYRGGFCGNDPTPLSNFYLFRNSEGFWLVKISDKISYRFLGKVFDRKWESSFEAIDLAKKYGNNRTIVPRKIVKQEKKENKSKTIDNEVYNVVAVQIRPDYPGGIQKFYAFIKKNYVIPKEILDEESSRGGVFAKFIIEKDGSLSEIEVLRDIGYGSGKELERVLKLSPNWIPAIKDGSPVRCLYSIPYYVQ